MAKIKHHTPIVGPDHGNPVSKNAWDEDHDGEALPTQWTAGVNGEVVATVDDPSKTPIKIQLPDGQTGRPFVVRSGKLAAYRDFLTGNTDVMRLTADTPGAGGNAIELQFPQPPPNGTHGISVVVVGTTIKVTPAETADVIVSTTADVIAAINATPASAALVNATLVAGPGTEVVGGNPPNPTALFGGTDGADLFEISARGEVSIAATHPYLTALTLRAIAAGSFEESTDIFRWFDEFGDVLGDLDAQGNLNFRDPTGVRVAILHSGRLFIVAHGDTEAQPTTPIFRVSTAGGGAPLSVFPSSSGIGVSIGGESGQVALSIGSWDENNDAINVTGGPDYNGGEFRVRGDGAISTKAHTAPADSSLVAGEMAIWFDQTDGAAKLRIKAKQADGTIRTGSVNLT